MIFHGDLSNKIGGMKSVWLFQDDFSWGIRRECRAFKGMKSIEAWPYSLECISWERWGWGTCSWRQSAVSWRPGDASDQEDELISQTVQLSHYPPVLKAGWQWESSL